MAKDQNRERKKNIDKEKGNKKSKRKLDFSQENRETPKRVRKQKSCRTCDRCEPSTSFAVDSQAPLLVALPSDDEELDDGFQDTNNSASIQEETEDENQQTRLKFRTERTDLNQTRKSGNSGVSVDEALPTIDVEALVEDEDDEETLEQIYAKVQRKLAERKKKRKQENNEKPKTGSPEEGGQDQRRSLDKERQRADQPLQQDLSDHRDARDRAEELVRQAELQKAEILRPTGEQQIPTLVSDRVSLMQVSTYTRPTEAGGNLNHRVPERVSNDLSCDNDHYMLAAHVDPVTTIRIQRGEYIPIEKLIPRSDRGLSYMDENRLELVQREGHAYFVPAEDKNLTPINNFRQWERAFRVYAGIFSQANPHRAAEMYQFVSNIQAASNVYIWENVASYDRIFRRLMHDNPGRNWGLIYQQAWTLELRVPLPYLQGNSQLQNKKGGNTSSRSLREACRKFNNTGKCSFGQSCKYDHRCNYCGKFGHGEIKCHKKINKTKEQNKDQTKEQ